MFEGVKGRYRVTQYELEDLIQKYDMFLQQHFKDKDQQKSVRKLVENLQEFNKDTDSPLELLKDVFMYIIQKQKYKKYKEDEWFVLTNSIHQFLLNIDMSSTNRIQKSESIVSNDYTVQYFENELNSYK